MDWRRQYHLKNSPETFLVSLAQSLEASGMKPLTCENPSWRAYSIVALLKPDSQEVARILAEFTPNQWANLRITNTSATAPNSEDIVNSWLAGLPRYLAEVTEESQPALAVGWALEHADAYQQQVFRARLLTTEAEFLEFIENRAERGNLSHDLFTESPFAPRSYAEAETLQSPPGFQFMRHLKYARYPVPEQIEGFDNFWNNKQLRNPGFLYLKTVWTRNRRKTYVGTLTGGVWREGVGGYIEYQPAKYRGCEAVDVTVVCRHSQLRDYLDWLTRRLLIEFPNVPMFKAGAGRPKGRRDTKTRKEYEQIIKWRNSPSSRLKTDAEFLENFRLRGKNISKSKLSRAKKWERDGKP
jgi:muconolactone delta-isomerase